MSSFQYLCLVAFMVLSTVHCSSKRDCMNWASKGECHKNPGYMLVHCKEECEEHEKKELESIAHIQSFYDLQAKDIDGNDVDFERFRGKVTIVVNVASYCGYTEQHYRELVQLHKDLLQATGAFEIVAFPCNQFGEQEPEECADIKLFAQRKGVKFLMMDKIDVNGDSTHIVYKYLKRMAGPTMIEWNFATYFVIGPDGNINSYSGVTPSELYDVALKNMEGEEL